jgi:hypothetical protein
MSNSQEEILYDDPHEDILLIRYSDKSLSLFTPKEWGLKHSNELKNYARYNRYLKLDGQSTPGWTFAVSNAEGMKYLNDMFNLDLPIPETPPRRSYKAGAEEKERDKRTATNSFRLSRGLIKRTEEDVNKDIDDVRRQISELEQRLSELRTEHDQLQK